MDLKSILLEPVYATWGVAATLATASGTTISLTAKDLTAPSSVNGFGVDFQADGQQSDGTFRAEVDTADMNPGAAFASLRAESPAGAEDIKFTITANAANPDPATA